MTTPQPPDRPEPASGPDAAESEALTASQASAPTAGPEPDPAGVAAEAGPSEATVGEAAAVQAAPDDVPATRPPAGPAPAWAWVAIVLMALLFAIGLATLAVARNTDPSTPEAVEDVQTLVAELEMLNASLATTNELMSNAISNAAQLSANAQAKLASLSAQLADVDVGVGQVRSLLGDKLSKPTRSELGNLQGQLQSRQGTLAQRTGRLEDQELARISGDVAAIDREAGIASSRDSRRTGAIEAEVATLESKQAENDEASAQIAELMAEAEQRRAQAEELRTSLQAQREHAQSLRTELRGLRRAHAAQLLQLKRALAVLQRRVDGLRPRP